MHGRGAESGGGRGEGGVYHLSGTAALAITFLGAGLGREMKTMVDLANPAYDQKLDEIAGKIVENHALGEKDAGYLNKEFYLGGGFKDIDVVKETSKIV